MKAKAQAYGRVKAREQARAQAAAEARARAAKRQVTDEDLAAFRDRDEKRIAEQKAKKEAQEREEAEKQVCRESVLCVCCEMLSAQQPLPPFSTKGPAGSAARQGAGQGGARPIATSAADAEPAEPGQGQVDQRRPRLRSRPAQASRPQLAGRLVDLNFVT